MNRTALLLACAIALAALPSSAAAAEPADPYETVRLELGTADGRMVFRPAMLELRVGQAYRLSVVNVSPVDHEFDAPEFALSVATERIEVFDAAGRKVAVLQGQPEEFSLSPGGRLDWYLVPTRTIPAAELRCDLPGHLQAGMRGSIQVH